MKSKFYVLFLFLCTTGVVHSQTGIGTTSPHPSAQLEVSSTEKGILIPRMSKADRNAIASPAEGLLIYQTDETKGFYYFDGVAWTPLTGSGQDGRGAIIPFASGPPISLLFDSGKSTGAAIGFGNSVSGVNYFNGLIDLTGTENMAFSVPRDGLITSVAAFFSTNTAISLIGSTITISAQLYASSTPDNTFTAVPGAKVYLSPFFSGFIPIGMVSNGILTGLAIPVTAETRLMLVFSIELLGDIQIATSLSGSASGGVAID